MHDFRISTGCDGENFKRLSQIPEKANEDNVRDFLTVFVECMDGLHHEFLSLVLMIIICKLWLIFAKLLARI